MAAGPGDELDAAGRGRLRASHADREQVAGVLKAAFVQGRLTKDELDARVGRAFAARTHADLAGLTADLPAGLAVAQTRAPAQAQGWLTMKRAVTCSACMVILTAMATAIGTVVAVRLDSGPAFLLPVLAFFAATVAAGTMISEAWDKQKRSGGQSPRRPAPGAGGRASRRPAPAGPDRQLPPAGHRDRHAAEASRSRRPGLRRPCAGSALTAS